MNKSCDKKQKDIQVMASRMKISTVLKMALVCVLFVCIAALGVTASNEVIQAAIGESKKQSHDGDDSQSTRQSMRGNMAFGAPLVGRASSQKMQKMMATASAAPPMMESMDMMHEEMAYTSGDNGAAAYGGGGRSNFATFRGREPSEEQILKEGGYDPNMGEDVLHTGGQSKFDPMKVEPMLVRTGNIQATTGHEDFDALQGQLQATILNIPGAYIESSNNYGGWKDQNDVMQGRSISIQARVPVDMFFKLRDNIVKVFPKGDVGSISDSVSDVTSQVR
jgi:hypothetical protein